jgi:hypothetical protein
MREDEMLTLPEVRRRTKLGVRQLRRAIDEGALPVFDIGSWPRVRWGDVLRWLERQRRPVQAAGNHGVLRGTNQ